MSTPPRHHTARGFRNNYIESATKSLRDVLRWQRERRRGHLPPPPTLPIPRVEPNLKFLRDNARCAADMQRTVTWIGHATALVQASGLTVLTDPIFSSRASPVQFAGPKRAHAAAIELHALPHVDVVLISHNHYDHLDRRSVATLAAQAGGEPLFVVPMGLKAWFKRQGIENAVELDWWQHHTHPGNAFGPVQFHLTPAQHWSGRGLSDRNQTLWGAFAVLAQDFHWYFSGDTGYSNDFVDTRTQFASRQTAQLGGGFDAALIAVGACLPRWFMHQQHVDVAEAVQVHVDLGAKISIGVHWGTFELADDPLDHPLHALGPALEGRGVSADSFLLLPLGGTRVFTARGAL